MRYLYVFSCCLLIAAVVAEAWGKRRYSKAAQIVAKAQSNHEGMDTANAEANAAISIGNVFTRGSLALAALGVVLWATSMVKERRLTLVPMALLALYVGLFLIVV
jgi:hypothetical protein